MARTIRHDELKGLLALYRQLHPDDPDVEENGSLQSVWDEIYNDPNLYYLVIEQGGAIISSCSLSIVKNLTRNLRPYGVIEHVITHADYRRRGYGTEVLRMAIATAMERDCYKVMLLTGSKQEEILRFYEKAGFARGVKTGFAIYF